MKAYSEDLRIDKDGIYANLTNPTEGSHVKHRPWG